MSSWQCKLPLHPELDPKIITCCDEHWLAGGVANASNWVGVACKDDITDIYCTLKHSVSRKSSTNYLFVWA